MVSILLISNSSRLAFKPYKVVQSVPITIGINVTLMFHSLFFYVLWQGQIIYLSFRFLLFLICGRSKGQNPLNGKFRLLWLLSLLLLNRNNYLKFSMLDKNG